LIAVLLVLRLEKNRGKPNLPAGFGGHPEPWQSRLTGLQ
jgi:hypothetical protein